MEDAVKVYVTDNSNSKVPWTLDGDINGQLTLKDLKNFVRNAHIAMSKEVLREEQSLGFDKKPRKRVDNVFDKPEEGVRAFGKIEYFARANMREVMLFAYETILNRSPSPSAETGAHFISSNYVFLNNRLIATDLSELTIWLNTSGTLLSPGAFIRFVNVTPYAARLEYKGISKGNRGKTKGKIVRRQRRGTSQKTGLRITKPNGVYLLSTRTIRNKFKAIAKFMKFSFMPNGTGGIYIKPSGDFRSSYINRPVVKGKRNRSGQPYVYPSISFQIAEGGIK